MVGHPECVFFELLATPSGKSRREILWVRPCKRMNFFARGIESRWRRERDSNPGPISSHRKIGAQAVTPSYAVEHAEAEFAKAELLKFSKSGRHRLNPLRIANALAGMPLIGCRRSGMRCAQWECPNAGGQAYQIFRAICRVVDSRDWGTDLVAHKE